MSIPTKALWTPELIDPSNQRVSKPRTIGLTMIIDKGLGIYESDDLCLNASSYIDFIKLGFGTMALYPRHILEKKLALFQKHKMNPYPGGTFFEVALHQGAISEYIRSLHQLSITTIEISDGTIEMSLVERKKWIQTFIDEGFTVITEYGKKLSGSQIDLNELYETIESDLECGASYIIVEGRESGQDVGLYNAKGDADIQLLTEILKHPQSRKLVWEAPQKQQQADFIRLIGTNVNLGNIAPNDIFGTESLRRGLRSDTFSLLI